MTDTITTTSTFEAQPEIKVTIPTEITDLQQRVTAIDPIKLQSCLIKLEALKLFNRFPITPKYKCRIADQEFTMEEIDTLIEEMTPVVHAQTEA